MSNTLAIISDSMALSQALVAAARYGHSTLCHTVCLLTAGYTGTNLYCLATEKNVY